MTDRTCSVSACGGRIVARGWCNRHYLRWRNHGDPVGGGPDLCPAIDHRDGSRTCTACGVRQPFENFDTDVTAARGRRSQCKQCRGEKVAAWYDANQERQRQRARERLVRDGDEIRARDRDRYVRDRPERIERATEITHLRRARAANVPAERGITVGALREIHGDVCPYCGVTMAFEKSVGHEHVPTKATVEHKTPLARRGAHSFENTILCCLSCNGQKKNRTLEEWNAYRDAPREGRPAI